MFCVMGGLYLYYAENNFCLEGEGTKINDRHHIWPKAILMVGVGDDHDPDDNVGRVGDDDDDVDMGLLR